MLRDLAYRGDITNLLAHAIRLEQDEARYAPFVTQVHTLA